MGKQTTAVSRPNANVQGVEVVDLDKLSYQPCKLVSINVAGPATLQPGDISGAALVSLMSSNAAPGTLTTRSAAQMFVDAGINAVGDNLSAWRVRITNTGAGTLTLAAGAGVTLTGTATVPTNTWREFVVQVTAVNALTMTATATGTYS